MCASSTEASARPGSAPGLPSGLAGFGDAARRWFEGAFGAPTPIQRSGWERIGAGEHALLVAPTGSGKTLAAFLAAIDRLTRLPEDARPGVRVVYVSPLKALVYDIERNLEAPLSGIRRLAPHLRLPRVAVRTGDTPASERRRQAREPAEILVTTPESLYLVLGSKQRETLRTVDTVIVDEVHALAATKRGAHLALSLERLCRETGGEPQRIGLSATARPTDEVARFLGGDRAVAVVDESAPPRLDLEIRVPVADMTRPDEDGAQPVRPGDEEAEAAGLWPAITRALLDEIRAHRTSLVFTNSRGLCERLARRLNDLAGEELVRSHHGSLAHDERRRIEAALSRGALRGIVATSSLELGIDMEAVDLVLLVESPGSVARGLQRVGRAGHRVGAVSRGRVYPKHRGDLLEATVVAEGMRRGDVEPLRVPANPLDVLAQQIVALCAVESLDVDALEGLVRRAASFRTLSREALCGVLDMLSGRHPSTDFGELRPRLSWDRRTDRLEARRGARQLALVSGGTIPDRGLFAVYRGEGGPRIGELDEEMVHETRVGEIVTLGASSWRVDEITRDRVIVSPAPGEAGRLPFWRGDGPGRPVELGRALGAFVRALGDACDARDPQAARARGEAWLRSRHALDPRAARNLVDHVLGQREATGCLPSDRAVTVERFRDELGDWRVCILSPFGARIHAPWALAVEAALAERGGAEAVQTLWSDDGIVLRFPGADGEGGGLAVEAPPDPRGWDPAEWLLPDPELAEGLVVSQLAHSALFASRFRENAARALLLPRRRPGSRTPLWTQRLRAQSLLAVAREYPSFPIVLETYRACLRDVFDVPGWLALLRDLRARRVALDVVETPAASPFARSLVFAYTAAYLYQGDTPAAERRAHALTLDRAMLRDLLGGEVLRDLLDAEVIAATEASLQGRDPEGRARHADALHDRLRREGDLSAAEIAARCAEPPAAWLSALEAEGRILGVALGGERRFIAAEDAGLYRDALDVRPPEEVPDAFLAPTERPLEQLVSRFARHRGPFEAGRLAARYGLAPARVEPTLAALARRGRLESGALHPDGAGTEWCDVEVLRRIRRRTLAKLRGQVAPVDAATHTRFLIDLQGVGPGGRGRGGLDAALARLEGVPLSFAELERAILPARVGGFDPRQLDELGSRGEWVWLGRGALGARDGRVALFRRDRVALLAEAPEPASDLAPLSRRVLELLETRGASFSSDLLRAAGDPPLRDLEQALWDLVWRGLVTNDTFAPLRRLAAGPRPARPGRRRRGTRSEPVAGRWSAVSRLVGTDGDATRRAHARAVGLLERYGVLSRDALANESLPGGFSSVYAVCRQMEESGRLRRGHFVEGLSGAQFAFAGTVDALRAARETRGGGVALAATDPANPFGALRPWPPALDPGASPRRAVGVDVAIVDGEAALLLDRGHRAWRFEGSGDPDERLAAALGALRGLFAGRRRRSLRIDALDGVPAARCAQRETLLAAGFRPDYKGFVLERSEALHGSPA